MKLRKYIAWELKELIPVMLVTFIFIMILGLNSVLNSGGGIHMGSDDSYIDPNSLIPYFTVVGLILSTVAPLYVNFYRHNKRKTDMLNAIPAESRTIRRTRIIIALAIILTILIVSFSLTLAVQGIHVAQLMTHYSLTKNTINYFHYFLVFGILLLFCTANYFINLFFASIATEFLDSMLAIVFGQIILGGFVLTCITMFDYQHLAPYLYPNFSAIEAGYIVIEKFNPLIKDTLWHPYFAPVDLVCTIIFFLLSIGGFVYCWNIKEPSGEQAGRPGSKTILEYTLAPIAAFSCGILFTSFFTIFVSIFFPLVAVAFYFAEVLYYRTAKLPKEAWIPMTSVGIFLLFISLSHTRYYI